MLQDNLNPRRVSPVDEPPDIVYFQINSLFLDLRQNGIKESDKQATERKSITNFSAAQPIGKSHNTSVTLMVITAIRMIMKAITFNVITSNWEILLLINKEISYCIVGDHVTEYEQPQFIQKIVLSFPRVTSSENK